MVQSYELLHNCSICQLKAGNGEDLIARNGRWSFKDKVLWVISAHLNLDTTRILTDICLLYRNLQKLQKSRIGRL